MAAYGTDKLDNEVDSVLKAPMLTAYDARTLEEPLARKLLGLKPKRSVVSQETVYSDYDELLATVKQRQVAASKKMGHALSPREQAVAVLNATPAMSDETLKKRLELIDRALQTLLSFDSRQPHATLSGGRTYFQWFPHLPPSQ